MASKVDQLILTLCGPGDVLKEIEIAQEVVYEWNVDHSEGLGVFVRHQHWQTDSYPDAKERGQGVINRQLIDGADILVCIFWNRFGSPTGVAASGTEEEIQRGISAGKHVAIYFSEIESNHPAEISQLRRLEEFRQHIRTKALIATFRSRIDFREQFRRHLAKIVHELRARLEKPKPKKKAVGSKGTVIQKMEGGSGNTQVAGDYYAAPPKIKQVVERRPDSITPAQAKQIQDWIESLVETTTNLTRGAAFKQWWKRLKNKFRVPEYKELPAADFPKVHAWYRQMHAIQVGSLKNKAPEVWQDARIGAIKAAMREMGRTNEEYYPELAARLRIPPFTSLKQLTKINLGRVYSRVMADKR